MSSGDCDPFDRRVKPFPSRTNEQRRPVRSQGAVHTVKRHPARRFDGAGRAFLTTRSSIPGGLFPGGQKSPK